MIRRVFITEKAKDQSGEPTACFPGDLSNISKPISVKTKNETEKGKDQTGEPTMCFPGDLSKI
jgi:hypothetical protein